MAKGNRATSAKPLTTRRMRAVISPRSTSLFWLDGATRSASVNTISSREAASSHLDNWGSESNRSWKALRSSKPMRICAPSISIRVSSRAVLNWRSMLMSDPSCDLCPDALAIEVAQQHMITVVITTHFGPRSQSSRDGPGRLRWDDLILGAIKHENRRRIGQMLRGAARLIHQIDQAINLVGANRMLIDRIARQLAQHFDVVAGDNVQPFAGDIHPRHGVSGKPQHAAIGRRHVRPRPHRRRHQNEI